MIGNAYKGSGFSGVLRYLHFGSKENPNPDRVAWHVVRNMPDVDTPGATAFLMRATANRNNRVQRPVYHLPISWPEDEVLDKDAQISVADKVVADLGLSEHQYTIIAHNDGDCPHVHLVINTVHPETGRVWNNYRDIYRIMESLERQEKELGLQEVERPDLDEWRTKGEDPERQKKPSRGERKRADREGDEPLTKWSEKDTRRIRKFLSPQFQRARSWADLEARLGNQGYELRRAGQGFRITDGSQYMTLSKIGKHARWDKLEERFGQTWDQYLATRPVHEHPPHSDDDVASDEGIAESPSSAEVQKKRNAVLQLYDTHTAYLAFRLRETEATELGRQLYKMRRKVRRADWVAETAQNDLEKASERYKGLFAAMYKDPDEAMGKFEAALREGKDLKDIDPEQIGKMRGWRIWGFRTPARRRAEEAMRRIPSQQQRLYKLKAQIESCQHDKLTIGTRTATVERDRSKVLKELGEDRKERRLALWKARHHVLRQLDQNDIWRSNLPEETKRELADAWEQEVQRIREKERKPKTPTYLLPGTIGDAPPPETKRMDKPEYPRMTSESEEKEIAELFRQEQQRDTKDKDQDRDR